MQTFTRTITDNLELLPISRKGKALDYINTSYAEYIFREHEMYLNFLWFFETVMEQVVQILPLWGPFY